MEVPLAKGRGVALVDAADYELVSQYRWFFDQRRPGATAYARAHVGRGRDRKYVRMHVLITGQRGLDHKDGDGLNNQRSNFRPATSSQNGGNRRKNRNASSAYKGASWITARSKWHAQIRVNWQLRHLGFFDDEIEAAKAYDTAAREAWGEYARCNFPENGA